MWHPLNEQDAHAIGSGDASEARIGSLFGIQGATAREDAGFLALCPGRYADGALAARLGLDSGDTAADPATYDVQDGEQRAEESR